MGRLAGEGDDGRQRHHDSERAEESTQDSRAQSHRYFLSQEMFRGRCSWQRYVPVLLRAQSPGERVVQPSSSGAMTVNLSRLHNARQAKNEQLPVAA